MLEKISNHSLVIIKNNLKIKLLKEISQNKKLINVKMMTKEEFIQNYYGKVKTRSHLFFDEKIFFKLFRRQKIPKKHLYTAPRNKKIL